MTAHSLSTDAGEVVGAAGWAPKSPSPRVRGPVRNGFRMLSALWLVPIVVWLAHGSSDAESSPLDLLDFGLTTLFWLGHRFCSTWLAYWTETYRPLMRTQPIRFIDRKESTHCETPIGYFAMLFSQ